MKPEASRKEPPGTGTAPAAGPSFRQAQWQVLFALMFCYLFFYTGRQNFGWAIKGIQDEFKLSPAELGIISGAMLACYGVGQAINGNLGDKFGGRRMVFLGALLSCALNWVTSFGHSFWTLLWPWMANGFVQSMSWAPGSRMLSNWWPAHERGKAFGFYTFSAGFSSVLIYGLAIVILQYLHWQWLFRLPVLLLAGAGCIFYLLARDRPQDKGFAPLTDDAVSAVASSQETSAQRYAAVIANVPFLAACLAIGFESMARYGLLVWVPVHYLGPDWKDNPQGVWITLALPVGMAFGALTSGYISDRLFRSNRSRTIALFLGLAAVVALSLYVVPKENKLAGLGLLFLAGFFVYGPQAAFWALCPDVLGRERSATGVGLMNAFAYGFAAIGEPLIGHLVQVQGNTTIIFGVVALACILGMLCILPVKR